MSLTFPTTTQKKPSGITALPNQMKRPAFGTLHGFDAQGGAAAAPVTRQDDIIHWWKFDEGTGTNVEDSGKTAGAYMTTQNTTSWVTGKTGTGYALQCDGSDDYALGEGTAIAKPTAYTLSCWINFDTLTTGKSHTGWYLREHDGTTYGIISMWKQGTQIFYQRSAGSLHNVTASETLSTGTWYNFAQTWSLSSGVMEAYINGASMGTVAAASMYDQTLQMDAGKYANYGDLDGAIDDLRLYDVALTDGEIEEIYNE